MTTKVLNLADLNTAPKVILTMPDGERHEMSSPTVQSFIDHVKMIEDLGPNASVAEEMEMMIKVILKAFPSLDEATVRGWPLTYLEQINDFIQTSSGMVATQDEEKAKEAEASGNGSTAT